MIYKIKQAIQRAGLETLPENDKDDLIDYGMDSLMMVLSVAELEKLFKIKIPASLFSEEKFESIHSIKEFMIQLGAK